MANSSSEWWSIDGVSLHQYGWSVTTVGGSRYSLPPRRGDNGTFPTRAGRFWRPKPADQRRIDLLMWIAGTDPGTGNAVTDPVLRFNDSWDFLRELVWQPNGAQVTLTRRWLRTTEAGVILHTAQALAEVTDTMEPTMTGRTRAEFTMSLLLADPYFYGPLISSPVMAIGEEPTVHNPGQDVAAWSGKLTVDFVGPLYRPLLYNLTPTPQVWLRYLGSVAGGDTLRCVVPDFTATKLSDGANVIGDISHFGARYWFGLGRKDNLLRFTSDAPGTDTGTAQLSFQPPYI